MVFKGLKANLNWKIHINFKTLIDKISTNRSEKDLLFYMTEPIRLNIKTKLTLIEIH
jgi:hypothetical protein